MNGAPEAVASLVFSVAIALDAADLCAREIVRGIQLCKWYGSSGIPLFIFGNRNTWRIQAQVLGQLNDDDALAFKRSVHDECTMIAVAVRFLPTRLQSYL